MADFAIGVRVDDSGAITSLDNISDKFYDIKDASDDVSKASVKNTKTIVKNNNKISKSLKTVKTSIKAVNKEFKNQAKVVSDLSKKIGKVGLAASIAAVGGSILTLKATVDKSKVFYDLEKSTGVAADALATYAQQAIITGGTIDNMSEALKTFTERVGEAQMDHNSAWFKAFDTMGVSIDKGVNKSLEDTLRLMGKLVDQGREAEALFIGRDLMGNDFDMSGFSRAVSGGSMGVNQLLSSGALSNLIPKKYLNMFSTMSNALVNLRDIVAVHIAPWAASLSNGITNIAKNIYALVSNTKPKSLEDANESIINAITGSIVWVQELIKEPFKKMGEMFQDYTFLFTTTMYSIAGILMGILNALGPLALMSLLLEDISTVASAGIAQATLWNPFASGSAKLEARKTMESLAIKQHEKAIDRYKLKNDLIEEELKSSKLTKEKIDELNEELAKNKKAITSKEKRISEIKKPDDNYKAELKAMKEELSRLKSIPSTIGVSKKDKEKAKEEYSKLKEEYIYLKKHKPFPTAMEIGASLKGAAINIGLAVGTGILGKMVNRGKGIINANKQVQTKGKEYLKGSSKYKAASTLEREAMEKAFDTRFSKANGEVFKQKQIANIEKAAQASRYGLLVSKITETFNSLKNFSSPLGEFKGMSEEEIRAMVESIFKLPEFKDIKTSKATKPDESGKVEVEVTTATGTQDAPLSIFETIFGEDYQSIIGSMAGFADQINGFIRDMISYSRDAKQNAYDKELSDLEKHHKNIYNQFQGSDSAKIRLQKKHDAELDKLKKEQFEKEKKQKISDLWINAWVNSDIAFGQAVAQLGFPAGPIVGGITKGIMMTSAAVAAAQVKKQEYFANSGFVDGPNGSTAGKDNRTVGARSGELFLNGRDQRSLFDWIKNGAGKAKQAVQLHIENFNGNDDDMNRLEDMLYRLNSNGRISDVVFA